MKVAGIAVWGMIAILAIVVVKDHLMPYLVGGG